MYGCIDRKYYSIRIIMNLFNFPTKNYEKSTQKTEKIFLGELSKGKRRAFIVIVGEGLFAQLIDNKFV